MYLMLSICRIVTIPFVIFLISIFCAIDLYPAAQRPGLKSGDGRGGICSRRMEATGLQAGELHAFNNSSLSVKLFSSGRSALAPNYSSREARLRESFPAHEVARSFRFVDSHISASVARLREVKGDDWVRDRVRERIIPVPGLLATAHQFARTDLTSGIIYMDADIYNVEAHRGLVREHEQAKMEGWNSVRERLGKSGDQMQEWIQRNAESQDPLLADTKYGGLGARQISEAIHNGSPSREAYERLYAHTDYSDKSANMAPASAAYLTYLGKCFEAVELDGIAAALRAQAARSWVEENVPSLKGKVVVSISMEGNIPEFAAYPMAQNANTKGGLGAYFGDKLEGLAQIGMTAYGVQPGYSHVIVNDKPVAVDYDRLIEMGILKPVLVGRDAIRVRAWFEDPMAYSVDDDDVKNPLIKVEVYEVDRGGTKNYVLRSKVFDMLYPDNDSARIMYRGVSLLPWMHSKMAMLGRRHRFTQELVFGKAVFELIKRLKLKPDILHLNEAHTVIAAAQLRSDPSFDGTAIVYTNHTIVPAGLERFVLRGDFDALEVDSSRMEEVLWNMSPERFRENKAAFLRPDGKVDFCHVAVELADVINAVSDEHTLATTKLFKGMYGDGFNKPVVGILNGSGETWINDKILALKRDGRTPTEDELWDIHEDGKRDAYDEVERRTGVRLDPSKPTLWAVRRIVGYKSQYPMLKFLVHLATADKDRWFTRDELANIWVKSGILDEPSDHTIASFLLDGIFQNRSEVNGLGMQVVVGGPEYVDHWVREFKRWSEDPDLKGRFVYVPESDPKLLKMQAIGADICINMPRPLEEACGTSDQRTGLNGGVNIALKGAGPIEWIVDYLKDAKNGSGFLFGPYTKETSKGLVALNEEFRLRGPLDIFKRLETCSYLYHEEKGKWKHLMHNSYQAAHKMVTAKAMEERYARGVYAQAVESRALLTGRTVSISSGGDVTVIVEPGKRVKTNDSKALVEQDMVNISHLLSSLIHDTLASGAYYVMRYNQDRFSRDGIAVIEAYVELMRSRSHRPGNIKLIPSQDDLLVSIASYKDASAYEREDIFGEGVVNSGDGLNKVDVIELLNIALAAASIRLNTRYSDMDDSERNLIRFIKDRCTVITGISDADLLEDNVLRFIRNLPAARPLPVNDIDEYNRAMLKRLQEAA